MRWHNVLAMMAIWGVVVTEPWTVASLVEYHRKCLTCETIINPDGVLTDEETRQVQEKISQIVGFKTRFIVIRQLDARYTSFFSGENIDSFVEYFLQDIEPSLERRLNSLTVLYSIDDRKYKWRTGAEARKLLPDSKCDKIAAAIRSELKARRYGAAFVRLFRMINEPEPVDWAFWGILLAIGGVISSLMICACLDNAKEQRLGAKIRTIKELNQSPEREKLFIEQNCVICFEALDNSQLRNDFRIQPDRPADVPLPPQPVPTPEIPEIKATDNERLLTGEEVAKRPPNLDQLPEGESAFLECGHNFHAGCLRSWFRNNQSCPVCRVKLGGATMASGTRPAGRQNNLLLDVFLLTNHDRYGRDNINYYYDNGRMPPAPSSGSGSSGGGRSFDFGSGGTSGGW